MRGSEPQERLAAQPAALAFVAEEFPDALAAMLAGSAARGQTTPTSDLDLILFTDRHDAPYRETFRFHGWPVEAFVYTPTSYREWFAKDMRRRRPSLLNMCADSVILLDDRGLATGVREEARRLLAAGPPPLTEEEMQAHRYRVTDLLMDMESASGEDALFIATALVPALAWLICDSRCQWRGEGKWLLRSVAGFSPRLADHLSRAMTDLGRNGDGSRLIELADEELVRVGGRLFEGYSAGKGPPPPARPGGEQ